MSTSPGIHRPRTLRLSRLLLWLPGVLLCILLWIPGVAGAQDAPDQSEQDAGVAAEPAGDDVRIEIGGRMRAAVRLAFPTASYSSELQGDFLAAAKEVEQTLREDLDQTRVFNTQGPTELAVLALTGERAADFDKYRSLGNEVVLLATLSREDDRLLLEGWVYDLASKQSVLGKSYRGTLDQARLIAHYLMDALYYQFMGRPSLALTNFVFQSDRTGYQELFLMDYDGHNQRQISRHQSTSGYADWSRQGDAIAYMSYFSGQAGIYYVDLSNGAKVPIYTEGTLNISPAFHPDGGRVAFASSVDANVDLFVCERVCEEPTRITRSRAIDTNPQWSPEGDRLAFTSSRSGRPHVYVMNADGSNVRRISFEGDYNEGASWHPDGNQVVYASRESNRFRVAVTDLVSLETRIVAASPRQSYEEPTFSPDGTKIAFTVRRGREAQIHVMNADGSDRRQLTYEGSNWAPDWSEPPPR